MVHNGSSEGDRHGGQRRRQNSSSSTRRGERSSVSEKLVPLLRSIHEKSDARILRILHPSLPARIGTFFYYFILFFIDSLILFAVNIVCTKRMQVQLYYLILSVVKILLLKVIEGFGVCKVIDSTDTNFTKGDLVSGITGWEEYSLIRSTDKLRKIVNTDLPFSYYLGLLGKYLKMWRKLVD